MSTRALEAARLLADRDDTRATSHLIERAVGFDQRDVIAMRLEQAKQIVDEKWRASWLETTAWARAKAAVDDALVEARERIEDDERAARAAEGTTNR